MHLEKSIRILKPFGHFEELSSTLMHGTYGANQVAKAIFSNIPAPGEPCPWGRGNRFPVATLTDLSSEL